MTTSPSTTAGKTSRPDVRRGAGEGGRVVKTAITGTARDILLPLCGHHREFVFTYHIPGGPGPDRVRVIQGRWEGSKKASASRRGGAHQSEGQGREFPIPRLPPWSGDEAPAKDQESENRQ